MTEVALDTAGVSPMPWTVYVRTKREYECGPGIWVRAAGEEWHTVIDTGAPNEWPISEADGRCLGDAWCAALAGIRV